MLVVRSRINRLRDRNLSLNEGEFAITPRGTEHCPVAGEEVHTLTPSPSLPAENQAQMD